MTFQAYERAEVALVQSLLIPEIDTIELGGALRVTGSVVLRELTPPARLISVEFRPELLPVLGRNLSINTCGNVFNVLQRAIGYPLGADPDTYADFVIPADSFGSRKSSKRVLGFWTIPAPTMTLRGIYKRFSLDSFQLICDIEGAELEMIEQDRAVLEEVSPAYHRTPRS